MARTSTVIIEKGSESMRVEAFELEKYKGRGWKLADSTSKAEAKSGGDKDTAKTDTETEADEQAAKSRGGKRSSK